MPTNQPRIPPVAVPDGLYELLRLYAFRKHLSLTGGVRALLVDSPSIQILAAEKGVDLSQVKINGWGGDRKSVTEDNPDLESDDNA
jgi:pyruvate/2-oxoglutarate dehydrogenase complex dihydrolipoamide acyltransferase (E2) component